MFEGLEVGEVIGMVLDLLDLHHGGDLFVSSQDRHHICSLLSVLSFLLIEKEKRKRRKEEGPSAWEMRASSMAVLFCQSLNSSWRLWNPCLLIRFAACTLS